MRTYEIVLRFVQNSKSEVPLLMLELPADGGNMSFRKSLQNTGFLHPEIYLLVSGSTC